MNRSELWHGAKTAARTGLETVKPRGPGSGCMWVWAELLLDLVPDEPPLRGASYADLIGYFASARPADPRVTQGAISREQSPEGTVISQVFLDSDGKVVTRPDGRPYGRRFLAHFLDAELEEAFGEGDLIIVS